MNSLQGYRKVSDPTPQYESLLPMWTRSRAVCSGERFVKAVDNIVSVFNLLIPFSPTMSQAQYNFYKAEAEFPGITSQFAKMLVGGLLRKKPLLTLADKLPSEASSWIINEFGQDGSTLVSFLYNALEEEIQTSRAWVYIDHPFVANNLTKKEKEKIKPYPVLWKPENIVNWRITTKDTGESILSQIIVRGLVEIIEEGEFHPKYRDTVWVHELDEQGLYQIRIFEKANDADEPLYLNGQRYNGKKADGEMFKEIDKITSILINNERLSFIPAWPLNGSINPIEPLLTPIIDKEIALYNKISRRNHLLYGAATYTPWISSDMSDDQFALIVDQGLGTWIHLRQEDKIGVLETPTDALKDMEEAIKNGYEEMAKLGIRMLTPETEQSGVALQLRNAAQTAQLGSLNTKVSETFRQIIVFMLSWRYGIDVELDDVIFGMSEDFDPVPIGADWLRFCTEWYEKGLLPRSVWLNLLKTNDMIPSDYDDKEGITEINDDELLIPKGTEDYANTLKR